MEAKIKEQEDLIAQLTRKSDEAGVKVENIALKAIEGASNQRATLFTRQPAETQPERFQTQGAK